MPSWLAAIADSLIALKIALGFYILVVAFLGRPFRWFSWLALGVIACASSAVQVFAVFGVWYLSVVVKLFFLKDEQL